MIGQNIPPLRHAAHGQNASAESSRQGRQPDGFARALLQEQGSLEKPGEESASQAVKEFHAKSAEARGDADHALLFITSFVTIPVERLPEPAPPPDLGQSTEPDRKRMVPRGDEASSRKSTPHLQSAGKRALPGQPLAEPAWAPVQVPGRIEPQFSLQGAAVSSLAYEAVTQTGQSDHTPAIPFVRRREAGGQEPAAGRQIDRMPAPDNQQDTSQPVAPYLGLAPQQPVYSDAARQVLKHLQRPAAELTSPDRPVGGGGSLRILKITLQPDDLGVVHVSMRLRGNDLAITIVAEESGAARLLMQDRSLLEGLLQQSPAEGAASMPAITIREAGLNARELSQDQPQSSDLFNQPPSGRGYGDPEGQRRSQFPDKAEGARMDHGSTPAHDNPASARTGNPGVVLL